MKTFIVAKVPIAARNLQRELEQANRSVATTTTAKQNKDLCPMCGASLEHFFRKRATDAAPSEQKAAPEGCNVAAVGDNGQRYEVTCFDATLNKRRVVGWSDTLEGALRLADGVEKKPSWQFPWLTDRSAAGWPR